MFSFKYLQRRKLHTLYTIGTITAVLAVIVLMGSVKKGFIETMTSHKRNAHFNLMITPTYSSGERGFYLDVKKYEEKLKKISLITRIEPVIEYSSFAKINGNKVRLSISSFSKNITRLQLDEGSFPKNIHEIVVDRSLTEQNKLEIGSKIIVDKKIFKISGFTKGHRYFVWPVVFLRLNMIQKMIKAKSKANIFYLDIRKKIDLGEAKNKIKRSLEPLFVKHKLIDGRTLKDGVRITTKTQSNQQIADHFASMDKMLAFLTVLLLSIGILVIGTSIYISVLERSLSISTIRAIGASDTYIGLMIVKEIAMTIFPSFIIGTLLGLTMSLAFSKFVNVDFSFSYKEITAALSYSALFVLAGGFFGIAKALSTDPLLVTTEVQ